METKEKTSSLLQENDLATIVQQYIESTRETAVFDMQRLHQLTNEQNKEFFYQTFPSFKND